MVGPPCRSPLNGVLCRNAAFAYVEGYGAYAPQGIGKIFWPPRDTPECKECILALIKAKLLIMILKGERI